MKIGSKIGTQLGARAQLGGGQKPLGAWTQRGDPVQLGIRTQLGGVWESDTVRDPDTVEGREGILFS
jgi:hypothetical protein